MTKILVVEDEAQTRNLFRECLEFEGYQTLEADNGLFGLQQAQQHRPDLVICDIIMPKLDGYEVLARLRQNPATAMIPLIFLTAKTTKAEQRQGMELGADDYLTKPSTAEELIRAVNARLDKQALLQKCYAAEYQQEPKSTRQPAAPPQSFFPYVTELKQVFQFIEANYDKGITLSDVAQAVGYSPAYLTNRVKRETGQTVNRWIIERRMEAARLLLKETEQSVEQIAITVGYANVCHFFRQFRQYNGFSPQAWRRQA
ncbi:MAG: response regulator [Cyanophyceae cyanobacterium]